MEPTEEAVVDEKAESVTEPAKKEEAVKTKEVTPEPQVKIKVEKKEVTRTATAEAVRGEYQLNTSAIFHEHFVRELAKLPDNASDSKYSNFFTVPLCFSRDRHVRSKYHHLIFVRLPPNILDIMIPPISSKL